MTAPERGDFIRDIVAADVRSRPRHVGRHALPAGAERLPPHRPREVDLPQFRRRRASSAAGATSASTTRTRPRRSRSTSTRSRRTSAGSASTGASTSTSRPTTSSSSTTGPSTSSSAGKAYVDDLSADEIREHRGTLTEPGRDSPWRDRPVDESLDLFERMRAGEFPNGARVLRAQIDMASPNINLRDPVLYRIVHADAPAHRRRVVHLPDVRLRPRPVGRDRGRHPLALHARVRGPPAALRLADREPARPVATAPDRVRPAQPDPHGALEALPAAARHRGPRPRLGRPAHADALRPAPARLPGRGDPRVRDDDRRGQGGQRHRDRPARARRARRPQSDGAAAVRASSTRSRSSSRTTPRGRPRRWRSPTTRRIRRPGRAKVRVRSRAVDRARRLHGGPAAEVLPPRARPRGPAALGVLRHLPRRRQGRRRRGRRAALHLRPGDARRRRARRPPTEGDAPLGVGRATPSRPRCACTTTSSPTRFPGADGRDLFADLNPDSETVRRRARSSSRRWSARQSARRSSSSGLATSRPIPTRRPSGRSSIGRSRSRTPGRRSRDRRSRGREPSSRSMEASATSSLAAAGASG